ncbi:VENN motif pre-toxin domain-containing protein [Kluyvera georgiana]|uniref:VENN motif pre-toxin domain-containing protein n=1 Tax=Kluyvera georgiana TaxID=73098 RepID=UPI003D991416
MSENIYGKDVSHLTEDEKTTLSAFASLAAGLAGGLAGGSTQDALNAGQAGKTTVENNYLSANQALTFDKELSDCRKSGGDCQAVIDKWKQVSDKQSAESDKKLKDDPVGAQVWDKEVAQGGSDMASRPSWLNAPAGASSMPTRK